MNFNSSKTLASEVYLIKKWNEHSGPPTQRRNEIFQEFVKLGMRERWQWHAQAEDYTFTAEEKEILACRDQQIRDIASWIGQDLRRVVVTNPAHPLELSDLQYRTDDDLEGDPMLVCEYEGDPFDVLPELAYSMSAYDDPDDVDEYRRSQRDQSLWVSGVFWIINKIVWVDEFGLTIREKVVCDQQELKEGAEAFKRFRPFESKWWTEATKVGKYAEDNWYC